MGFRIKEFLLKVAHEQIGIGGGHTGAHGRAFDLEVMVGVEGEVLWVRINWVSLTRN